MHADVSEANFILPGGVWQGGGGGIAEIPHDSPRGILKKLQILVILCRKQLLSLTYLQLCSADMRKTIQNWFVGIQLWPSTCRFGRIFLKLSVKWGPLIYVLILNDNLCVLRKVIKPKCNKLSKNIKYYFSFYIDL